MTVFKAFLKVVRANLGMIILYTVLLLAFGGINMDSNNGAGSFTESKPSVLVQDEDGSKLSTAFVDYIYSKCEKADVKNEEDAIKDALFYRDVSIIVTIPKGFGAGITEGNAKAVEIQSVGDYSAAYVEMLLERYLKVAQIYGSYGNNEDELIEKIQNAVSNEVEVEVTSKLNTSQITRLSGFFNFMNYSLLAGCVYVICIVLATFREQRIARRTLISPMNYKKHNRLLLACNALLAFAIWLLYMILGLVKVGAEAMFTTRGAMFMLNSFVFAVCALCLAFLIGNLTSNKEAMSGIINVVALGSSFLCGAFVPAQWLPEGVLTAARILPSYWFINGNDRLAAIEELNMESLGPVFVNMGVVLGFALLFIIISNVVSRKKMRA